MDMNKMHVLAAIGLYGDSWGEVRRMATREVVDPETGQHRKLMTESDASRALLDLVHTGRVTRTGYGQQAFFTRGTAV